MDAGLCGVHARRSACIPKALRFIGTQRVCFLYGKIVEIIAKKTLARSCRERVKEHIHI
ncbi:unnamed protein product [Trichogramma brassicae]|uniref:Uncharacterized protein n=1 Tax=Trichogramma brassicae TaxID=86971 RepID=A0A6H5I393_9HYME|nr:unnamed protein product [Trichogramma brassicae]